VRAGRSVFRAARRMGARDVSRERLPTTARAGVFVCQGDETLSRPHEALDIILAGSILVLEYFQLLNGNCFIACFVKEAMHGKQGSKVWWSVPVRHGAHPALVVRICGRSSMAGNIH